MNYKVSRKNNNVSNKKTCIKVDGFNLPSKKGSFTINDTLINNISIIDDDIKKVFISNKVLKNYDKLIKKITIQLVDDDDDGNNSSLILDEIEKFRLEIKNKYRDDLSKEKLKEMSQKLKFLKSEALKKQILIEQSLKEDVHSNRRSK